MPWHSNTMLMLTVFLLIVSVIPPCYSQVTNTSSTSIPPTGPTFLEFFTLNTTEGVNAESVGHFNDGVSHAIHLPQGIRFGNLHHTFIFISTNGIISFGEPFYVTPPVRFPSPLSTVSGSYLVAPFWSDVDITMSGNIHYEVHMDNIFGYSLALGNVSQFISRSASVDFLGTWMLVVSWESVHPWPNGIAEALPFLKLFYPDYDANNTYQAIIITDGVDTYSVFTYKCGDMEWARSGTIGYNAGGESFRNHPTSGETGAPSIACLNSPDNEWVNVVYQLNVDNPTPPPEPATVEPPQSRYLPMLDFTGQAVVSGILQRCQNCTSGAINITSGFPFGSYYHDTVFVGTNGIISFDRELRNDFPEAFPSEMDIKVYTGYLVAPYWSNIDTRLEGQVRYEVFQSSDGGNATGGRLQLVTDFISSEFDPDFVGGSWMLVATWRGVHPAPHGDSAEQDREDPYLQSTNTFQAVLISNGTKAYAVFTYTCDTMQWSDEATIGFNAAGTLYKLHPLSGRLHASAIDCVHMLNGSFINNVIFDLAPEEPEGTVPPITERNEIPFIIGITEGVTNVSLPSFVDGASDAISIDLPGFPFANSYQTVAYVGTNGVISFGRSFIEHSPVEFPSAFPEVYTSYILAPFWADIDITLSGAVYYETHTTAVQGSRDLLDRVSSFISFTTEEEFQGTWMLIALWDNVPPYAGGFLGLEANSFQGIAITNGNQSYAVYTYRCGHLEWSNEAIIGFNGGSSTDYFVVHPLSGSDDAQSIACKEFPDSEWTNVVYNVSIENVVTKPPLNTSEPPQSVYLPFLEKTGINQGVLANCDDCHSTEINMSSEPFPFGNYTHQVAFVSTNGIISFGKEFINAGSRLFPSYTIAGIHYSYVLAPYWSDIDTRDRGEVWYETHFRNQNSTSDGLLDQVSSFINNQTDASAFIGTLMIVVKWDSVPPYTGEGGFSPTVSSNTFQAVLITNGTKSYAIYTYKCDLLEWSNAATIGYNAVGDFYLNHPFSGTELSDDIDCVHRLDSVWNNEVYDLVPGELREGPTPPPIDSLGSCALAGFTECCQGFNCLGSAPSDCYCDNGCLQFGDCCSDIQETCEPTLSYLNATLVIANQHTLTLINGSSIETLLVNDQSALYIAVDYDYQRGYLYYSDAVANTISRAGLDGSNPEVIVDSVIEYVDGISVDWINNKLYWTDAVYARIEVIDLETFNRKLLFVAGPHTAPRAIAVDPSTRYIYWTDWGEPAKIERASMDGTGREVLHSTGLIYPNGLTTDYHDQRIYWADASLDRIEYSNVDGSQRVVLETEEDGLSRPFGLTLHNDILYWTDWNELAVYMTHKVLGETILPVYENLALLPCGIEAISPDRQQQVSNPCDGHTCGYLCLLSSTATIGYSCACPDGSTLLGNGRDCSNITTPSTPTPSGGSCVAAGYDRCCVGGLCYGSPPTCFCEEICTLFGDCCEDFDVICGPETTTDAPTTMVTMGTTEMQTTTPITTISTTPPYDCNFESPSPVRNLSLIPISASTLNITWTFPVTNTPGVVCLDDSFTVIIKTFSGDSVFQATVAGEETSVLVQGLERWILYNISVVANNMYGPSDPVYAAIFTEEGIPPIAPANVDINRTSTTEMTVSWDLLTPQQATGFLTSYTVVYTEVVPTITRRRRQTTNTKVEVEVEVAPDKNQVTIDNLSPDDSYIVSVRANTAAGKGVVSDPITSLALTITGAPNIAGPVNGGAVAGSLVSVVIVVVVCVVAIGVVLVMVLRRRKKTGDSEDYARFDNEEQLIAVDAGAQSDSYHPDLVNQTQTPILTGAPAYENPTYGKLCDVTGEEVKKDGEEARYAEVKKKQTNEESAVYDVPASPLPGYDVVQKNVSLNEYQRMDEV